MRTISIFVALLIVMAAPLTLSELIWWRFIPATIVLMIISVLLPGVGGFKGIGWPLTRRDGFVVLSALICMYFASYQLVQAVLPELGLFQIEPAWIFILGFLFQALNEELVLRGFLLRRCLKLASLPWVVVGHALFFAILHMLLYRFSNDYAMLLPLKSFLTLVFAGVAMNLLFVARGNIGLSFAFHAGWNLAWLLPNTFNLERGLNEPELFALTLSHSSVLFAAVGSAVLATGIYWFQGTQISRRFGSSKINQPFI